MLWNQIFYFYVRYIFGGFVFNVNAYETYDGMLGAYYQSGNARLTTAGATISMFGVNYPIGNYFSFIATLITIIIILVLCGLLIKKIYNICAHVIG